MAQESDRSGSIRVGRRTFVAGLGAASALATIGARSARAQAQRPIIGFLNPQTPEGFADNINAFLASLKDLGYVDGQNVTIEYRHAAGVAANYGTLAGELARLGSSVIVVGSAASLPASQATSTVPIVVGNFSFGTAGHLQLVGPNLAKPLVANVTGMLNADIGPRQQFELLKEIVPGLTQVGYLLDTGAADGGVATKARAEAGAAAAGVTLVLSEAPSPARIEAAVGSLVTQRVRAFGLSPSATFDVNKEKIVPQINAAKIASAYPSAVWMNAGGLLSAGGLPSTVSFGRAAGHVVKILRGAKPSDLPVELVDGLTVGVNLKTAQAIGVTIPAAVIARATDKVA